LRNESLLTTLGHDPKMANASNRLDPENENRLACEGMIRITNHDGFCRLTLMMGSMLILRLADRPRY